MSRSQVSEHKAEAYSDKTHGLHATLNAYSGFYSDSRLFIAKLSTVSNGDGRSIQTMEKIFGRGSQVLKPVVIELQLSERRTNRDAIEEDNLRAL